MMKAVQVLAVGALLTGCAADAQPGDISEEEVRASTAVVELAVDANGKCGVRSGANPRVKYDRVVKLKNVGDKPIAALVQLWDSFGGMPAPEGGDIAPGQWISVKMNTKWWQLNDEPDSRTWSTGIVCKRGAWEDDSVELEEVTRVDVYR